MLLMVSSVVLCLSPKVKFSMRCRANVHETVGSRRLTSQASPAAALLAAVGWMPGLGLREVGRAWRFRSASQRFNDSWHSPDGFPESKLSTLMSSSKSGQWIPAPLPIKRQWLRSLELPCRRRGYQAKGTESVRPSAKCTVRVSSVTPTLSAASSRPVNHQSIHANSLAVAPVCAQPPVPATLGWHSSQPSVGVQSRRNWLESGLKALSFAFDSGLEVYGCPCGLKT
jgi:hypothetical protein